jgi:predicted dehydrogenase
MTMADTDEATYGLAAIAKVGQIVAPGLPYQPQDPPNYSPPIALIGCGGVSEQHLTAYRKAGYHVVALVDRHIERAERRRDQFFPQAEVYADYRAVLDRQEIEVVDLTPHPKDRLLLIEQALLAGKHVLSQKPFVLDLEEGERLINLAHRQRVQLAVNQNGRWAPHFSYMRQAINSGLLGDPIAAHFSVHWNHHWIVGTPFEDIPALVLFDFGIHWFDMLTCVMGAKPPRRVYATMTRSSGQTARPPLLAQVLVEYDDAQASLVFDADTRFDPLDQSILVGTRGTIRSEGLDLQQQSLTITTAEGTARPQLEGKWFPDGFHGTMTELLSAIEGRREPSHSASNNLVSLALCFAAVTSAAKKEPVAVGSVRKML